MKKSIIIVDLILIVLFAILVASNIFKFENPRIVQMLFMVSLSVHIYQHWRSLVAMTKNLFKK
jgi:hypothetical protein